MKVESLILQNMKISPPAALCVVLSLVSVQSDSGAGPHQERQNRLLPDFEPFDHPSKKIGDSATTKGSGPISEVEWVEKVVPLFGKIQIQTKVGKTDSSSSKMPLIITLVIGGCLLCGVLFNQRSPVEQNNVKKQKENLHEVTDTNILPELPPTTVSGTKNRKQDENISPCR